MTRFSAQASERGAGSLRFFPCHITKEGWQTQKCQRHRAGWAALSWRPGRLSLGPCMHNSSASEVYCTPVKGEDGPGREAVGLIRNAQ